MNYDLGFSSATHGVMAGWLLLLLAPRWCWTRRLIPWLAIAPLCASYAILLAIGSFGAGGGEGGFSSLEQVRLLFSSDAVLLAGWLHYLAFDLFVGLWMTGDSRGRSISRWLVAPCLMLTFFAGPVGLLLYLALRSVRPGEPTLFAERSHG